MTSDLANLRTASLYINNQLLSRGLLRDGQTIDFADPAGDGDATATMARIISVVNDLILRRDRDAQHRESLSAALRTVRADALRQANDLQRARERHADAQRRADLGDAAEASLRAQLAAAESSIRKLRDDAARMRQLVAQTRASCAHEVRKRDRQIDGLKRAVTDAGRARGERRSPNVTTISISGGDGAGAGAAETSSTGFSHKSSPVRPSPLSDGAAAVPPPDDDPLRSETNAFLADLARSLSEDNETLLRLVQHTSRQLKAMSGYDGAGSDGDSNSDVATDGSDQATAPRGDTEDADNDDDDGAPDSSRDLADAQALARDMDGVLDHLRTILTNPSFVPIEEVMQRESEIFRLRDGWEKMEGRWKEAVHLLDGWRRRMTAAGGGRPVNVEEIKMGLRLSPVRVRNVAETAQSGLHLRLPALEEAEEAEEAEEKVEDAPLGRSPSPETSLHLVPAPEDAEQDDEQDDSDSASDTSSLFAEDDAPNVQVIEQSMVMPSSSLPADHADADTTKPAWARLSPSPPPPEVPVPSRVTKEVLRPSGAAGNRGAGRTVVVVPPTNGKEAKVTAAATKTAETNLTAKRTAASATAAPSAASRGRSRAQQGETTVVTEPAQAEPRPTQQRGVGQAHRVGPSGNRIMATKPVTAPPAPSARNRLVTRAEIAAPAPRQRAAGAKAMTAPLSSTAERDMPPPPVPSAATTAPAAPAAPAGTTTAAAVAAHRARSRSPTKIATVSPASASSSSSASSASSASSSAPTTATAPGAGSRLPLPTTTATAVPASPALNMAAIAAKLAASEREADAARVRAKLKAARGGRAAAGGGSGGGPREPVVATVSAATVDTVSAKVDVVEAGDPVKRTVPQVPEVGQQQPVRKRREQRRASKVASRRRSTLNPWELASLMASSGSGGEAAAEAGQ